MTYSLRGSAVRFIKYGAESLENLRKNISPVINRIICITRQVRGESENFRADVRVIPTQHAFDKFVEYK